ncbi:uncharacterized protein LOC117103862, partial [Anneissia japonica]|uniref:uncharacterized protein LOC117103862 n=1 Tax=Anneissia japonica TaxID=1529436 RepID=UPI0014256EC0
MVPATLACPQQGLYGPVHQDDYYYEVPLMNTTNIDFVLHNSMRLKTIVCFSSINEVRLIALLNSTQDGCPFNDTTDTILIQNTQNHKIEVVVESGNTHHCDNVDIHIHMEFMTEGIGNGTFFNKTTGNLTIRLNEPYENIYFQKNNANHQCELGSNPCGGSSSCPTGWTCNRVDETQYSCTCRECEKYLGEECNGVNKLKTFVCGRICSYNHLGIQCNPSNMFYIDPSYCCFLSITKNEECSHTNYAEVQTSEYTHSYTDTSFNTYTEAEEDDNYYAVSLMNAPKIDFVLNISTHREIIVCFSSINEVRQIAMLNSRSQDVCPLNNATDTILIKRNQNTCKIREVESNNTHNCDNLQDIHIHMEFMTEGIGKGTFFNATTGNLTIRLNEPYEYIYYEKNNANIHCNLVPSPCGTGSPCRNGWHCKMSNGTPDYTCQCGQASCH